MEKVKAIATIGSILLACVQLAGAQRVFPEDQLQKWGYKSTEVAEGRHAIRSLENHGDPEEAFYARFILRVLPFASAAEAAAAKEKADAARESTVLGKDKDYRRYLQQGKVLYVIDATSNYTRLEHQPKLMAQVKAYLASGEL